MFWSSWEAQILPNPLRAIGQVASSYLMTKDLDGMASYFDRSSKQFGNMLETILTQQNMKALLDHNFEANLGLLEQMIANPFLPISTATTAACALENLIQQYGSKAKALEHWKHGTSEYWPIQILNKRFQGISHLQKLRNIHNAVDDLCKSGNLFAAHSLRQWATQMGLLLFPKTNELMVLTPYFVTPSFRAYPLEKWALSHDLCQHTPVSLSGRQLRALDELITSKSIQAANLTSIPHDTAKWLVDNVSEPRSSSHEIDLNNTNCLPTWLVVAQCLQHSGSHFAQPSTWFTLGSTWLDQVPDTSMWLRDLTDWIRFAPSVEHKSALLLAGLFHSKSQSWIIKNYLMNSNAVYSLLVSEAIEQLSEEQRKQLYEILKPQQTNVEAVANVVRELSITPMDMEKVKRAADTIPKDCLTKELASLIGAKPSLKPNVLQFLSKHHPDLVPAFFNDVLATISIRPRFLRLARQFYDDMTEAKIELSQLDVKNQAFMYTAVHLLDPVQSLTPETFVGLNKFLTVIAEHMDGNLLQSAVLNARPFISYGIGEAFLALARFYRGEKLDWFDRACIRYHKLGPLLQIRGTSTVRSKQSTARYVDPNEELSLRYILYSQSAILRQPLSAVAESLIRAQSDPDQLNSQLALVSASWSIQRRNALLAYLTAEGASQVIERVIALTPESNRLKQLPFQAFATMIQAHYKADVNPEEARKVIQSALSSLAQIPASDIASCLKGPHVESLFRCWPNEKLPELVKFVHDSSPTERSSINLQLTSILINRGRLDLAEQLIKAIGPLPVTFLAGSPRHTLLPEDFKATLKYLRAADPDHVPAFVDTCLRNAGKWWLLWS
ncbi:unnamed protein product [Echinostoma caproni]|uniref:Uncharacterized protein n=1 Tax=Echinostoma caproni TaxID=27848 RepID=A0A3P8HZ91_9TREM|nr:unnamed protein product [Echinostoma caproni]